MKALQDPPQIFKQSQGIFSLAFSPDGKWLASGSTDTTARVWQTAASSLPPLVLRSHVDVIASVAFTTDSTRLVTASWDGSLRVWPLNPLEVVKAACPTVGRNFTPDEWTQYFAGEAYHKTCPQWP